MQEFQCTDCNWESQIKDFRMAGKKKNICLFMAMAVFLSITLFSPLIITHLLKSHMLINLMFKENIRLLNLNGHFIFYFLLYHFQVKVSGNGLLYYIIIFGSEMHTKINILFSRKYLFAYSYIGWRIGYSHKNITIIVTDGIYLNLQ